MSEVLHFELNKPETIALKFPEGKTILDGWQHEKIMFSLADDRVIFVKPDLAQRIRLLDVKPGESFVIRKWKKGRMNKWDLWLSPETEKAKAAEEAPALEAQLRDSLILAEARKNADAKLAAAGVSPKAANGSLYAVPVSSNGGSVSPKPANVSKQPYGLAFARFLIEAGRAAHQAETELGSEGASVRFDSRDIAAIATTMFIGANDRGCLEVGL